MLIACKKLNKNFMKIITRSKVKNLITENPGERWQNKNKNKEE